VFKIVLHQEELPGAFRIQGRYGQILPLSPTQQRWKETAMARRKRSAKQNGTTKAVAVTALGAAGFGLSLAGSASASTMPTAAVPPSDDNNWSEQRFVLGEEEMADVSLATFHLFDKEQGTSGLQQVAWRGCRCGGCRGCRGCGWRACRCGGCGGCGGCCRRWGRCRWC
jgi:hypothetical protein